jgi:hypothetical protein
MAQLTPFPIKPPPGVVLTDSERVVEGRWIASRNIRFVKGQAQKTGGNVRAVTTPTSGVPRSAHAWRDDFQNNYMAVGTYRKLYVYDTGWVQNDITPFIATGTLGSNPFTTSSGTTTVTVAHATHNRNIGDTIIFSGSTAVGGITPNGTFIVSSVVDSGHYTFEFSSTASSTATGGGASVAYSYEVPIGNEYGIYGLGWGAGGWGVGTWGTPRDPSNASSTLFIEPRIWSLDHFGKLLVCAYNGGSVYSFDPTALQPWGRAQLVDASAPTNVRFVFVTNERFIFALLSGMQVAWPSQGTLNDWTPTSTNTANVRTLTEGTKLVAGRVLADFISLVWSDAALFLFQYTGSTFIYNSSMVAKDCGLIAPGAAVTAGGIAFWMGQKNFWTYNGSVSPMPNVEDVRKYVFDSLDINMGYQAQAIYNPAYNEVWFFWTQSGNTAPNKGLIYDIDSGTWAPLDYGRTCGTHFTQGDVSPYMGAQDGYLYQHEQGLDDNGVPLTWSLTLAPAALNQGYMMMDLSYIVPDFFEQVGDITLSVTTWDRLNDSTPEDSESDVVTVLDSGTIDMHVSGRYIGLTMSCTAMGSYVRLGIPVAFIQPSGNRS